ncbi:MAG: F0F1 ATP synthase subunit B [Clostridia bacterium]|nr:F0F1 ATP synthase subunit B [Clostridia bacterium]
MTGDFILEFYKFPVALAAGDYQGLISFDVWTSLFTLCNLLIVFYFGKKFLFGPIKKMIDERQKEIDTMYDDAGKSRDDAAKLKEEYEEKLQKAQEESEELMRRTVRNAKLKEEEILKSAREEASATLKRADAQIEMERRQALNDIKDEVSGLAIDIAGAVLSRDINEKEHEEMIDSFIQNLGESND